MTNNRITVAKYRGIVRKRKKTKALIADDPRPRIAAQTFWLDTAPSVNKLYPGLARRHRSKEYDAWIDGQLNALTAQRASPAVVPAAIYITVPDGGKADLDGKAKATIDLLVKSGVLPDDGPKYVRKITLDFGQERLMRVTVRALIPTWENMLGISSYCTGDLSSEEFFRRQRDEWDKK